MKIQSMESPVNVLVLYVIYTLWAEGFSAAAEAKDLEDSVWDLGASGDLDYTSKTKGCHYQFFIGLILVDLFQGVLA